MVQYLIHSGQGNPMAITVRNWPSEEILCRLELSSLDTRYMFVNRMKFAWGDSPGTDERVKGLPHGTEN
jgi:hypothetical protein